MKYYAVRNGRTVGIFTDWESCRKQVDGFSGAEYKAFSKESDARAYLGGISATAPQGTFAYVDGSFNAETKEYSFGAVIFSDGEVFEYSKKFSDAETAEMRNVAGEIMGAEFVMQYCIDKGIKSVKIIYDYTGIEAWATGKWKTNKAGTIAYKAFCDSIKDKLLVEFEKVKGHSGDKYNDRADALAKEALGIKKSFS